MKEWIVELCPEISEWQADMIAEAVYNSVLEEREACAQIVEQYTGAWDDQGYALAQSIRNRGEK
jgi:hypothetical protein